MVLGWLQLQGLTGLGAPEDAEIECRAVACAAAFMSAWAPLRPVAAIA